jgi:hypothetical protein
MRQLYPFFDPDLTDDRRPLERGHLARAKFSSEEANKHQTVWLGIILPRVVPRLPIAQPVAVSLQVQGHRCQADKKGKLFCSSSSLPVSPKKRTF